jgi:hypothetical protein
MNNEQNFNKLRELIEYLDEMVSSLIAEEYSDIEIFMSNHSWAMERLISWNSPSDNLDFFEYVVERDINLFIRYREIAAALIGMNNTIIHFEEHQKLMQAAAWRSLQGDIANAH